MKHEILTNELDDATKLLISKVESLEAEVTNYKKELSSKEKEILELKTEIEFLKGIILNKNKKILGISSEKIDITQLSLFNEAEKFSDSTIEEPALEEVTYEITKRKPTVGKKENIKNLERVIIDHRLEGEELKCKKCNEELVEIGVKQTKEVLKYIPAQLIIEEHRIYSYACKSCEKENIETNILSTKMPKTIFYNSMASNELVAHTLILKYQHSMPLYRQEIYFDMMGASISIQTLCNWTLSAADALTPIYNHMKKELLTRRYIQADETHLKVIKDNGHDSKSKKYMWLYMSNLNFKPVILYDYQSTRSGSCPKNFLGTNKFFLQTDGYTGYNSVYSATRVYCLAHIRRPFHDIVATLDKEALKNSIAAIGFNYCSQIYKVEKELREKYSNLENYYDIRFKIRAEQTAPIIDDFIEYVEREIPKALPKSPLGKALQYAKNHLPGLKNVLLDGCLEVDNNAAERAIKSFVIGRKNFLFSYTSKGATASANIYSIVETAKANKLVVEKYLIYLFDNLAKIDVSNIELLADLMPWSDKLPDNMKIKDIK